MTATNRILIVDDHAPFRSAVREFLSQEPDLEVVGEAGSLGEAISCVGTLSPHLVLTDLAMPDAHGTDAVIGLRCHFPEVKILVVSFEQGGEYRYQCRKAGAAGYVSKDAIYDELRDGIRTVLEGRMYFSAVPPDEMLSDHARGAAGTN